MRVIYSVCTAFQPIDEYQDFPISTFAENHVKVWIDLPRGPVVKRCLVGAILFMSSAAAVAATSNWKWNELSNPKEVSQKGDIVHFVVHPVARKGIRQELVYGPKAQPSEARQFEVWLRLPTTTIGSSLSGEFKSVTLARWNENITAGGKRPPLSLRLRQGHLVATVWNDALYKQDAEGDGLVVFDQAVDADRWYRVSGCLQFEPHHGKVKIQIQSCKLERDCLTAAVDTQYTGQPGFGFSDSIDYEFRLGVYSSAPSASTKSVFVVDDRIVSDQAKVFGDCKL